MWEGSCRCKAERKEKLSFQVFFFFFAKYQNTFFASRPARLFSFGFLFAN